MHFKYEKKTFINLCLLQNSSDQMAVSDSSEVGGQESLMVKLGNTFLYSKCRKAGVLRVVTFADSFRVELAKKCLRLMLKTS